MGLREQFTDQLKTAMKAGDAARTSTLRMILAKLKDTDIAARPKGVDQVPDDRDRRHAARHGEVAPRIGDAVPPGQPPGTCRQGRSRDRGDRELPAADQWTRPPRRRRSTPRSPRPGPPRSRTWARSWRRCAPTTPPALDMASAGPVGESQARRLMALPSAFLDELRARTPLAALIGRRVRLERAGRQWKACCPFHGEKTPSFYVYDDHYHCFGCGAHGDAISFVMQIRGRRLHGGGRAAGRRGGAGGAEALPRGRRGGTPAPRPGRRAGVAAAAYQRRLFLPEGRAALDYLLGRGLTEETIRRFGLGWSGEGRGALVSGAGTRGRSARTCSPRPGCCAREDPTGARVGIVLQPGDVPDPRPPRPGDQLRRPHPGRRPAEIPERPGDGAVFQAPQPLRARSGARACAGPARTAGRRPDVVVVEGYMDVIALHQAGFGGAVAPARHRADRGATGGAVAPVAGARAVFRRRRRRRPRRGPSGRTGAAAAGAGPLAALCRAAGGRGPGHPGPASGTGGVPGGPGRRAAAVPTCCTTCSAIPAAGATPEQRAAFSAGCWLRRSGSPIGAWRANTARRCWTGSSPPAAPAAAAGAGRRVGRRSESAVAAGRASGPAAPHPAAGRPGCRPDERHRGPCLPTRSRPPSGCASCSPSCCATRSSGRCRARR